MPEYIIDTNVPLVASGLSEQMSPDCQEHCVNFLDQLFNDRFFLVIDDGYFILGEYENEMKKRQPGTYAYQFLKWIFKNYSNDHRIKLVSINPIGNAGIEFEEFPESLKVIGFDNSDRKFIAVAVANNYEAPVIEAADSKWIGWEKELNDEGINVLFLCKEELRLIYERKMGN